MEKHDIQSLVKKVFTELTWKEAGEEAFTLGKLFLAGKELPKNDYQAIGFIRHSAMLGYVPAQILLADLYLEGTCVKQDTERAKKWLSYALEAGSDEASDKRNRVKSSNENTGDEPLLIAYCEYQSGAAEDYEEGVFTVDDEEWVGRIIWENHSDYEVQVFLTSVLKIEMVLNAVIKGKTEEILFDEREYVGGSGKGSRIEIDDMDDVSDFDLNNFEGDGCIEEMLFECYEREGRWVYKDDSKEKVNHGGKPGEGLEENIKKLGDSEILITCCFDDEIEVLHHRYSEYIRMELLKLV